jgi:hypothetical protein
LKKLDLEPGLEKEPEARKIGAKRKRPQRPTGRAHVFCTENPMSERESLIEWRALLRRTVDAATDSAVKSGPKLTPLNRALPISPDTRWFTRLEAAAYVRLSPRQFDRERKDGRFLPTGGSSRRRPLWDRIELDRELGATSDRDPVMALIDAE